jgi:hypothetical protein
MSDSYNSLIFLTNSHLVCHLGTLGLSMFLFGSLVLPQRLEELILQKLRLSNRLIRDHK